jgi:peptidoglycan L-alanyl-D-glutamate endopeptidase CwlK
MKFGRRSKERLGTCCKQLQEVCAKALSYSVFDFSIIEGHRTVERQKELYDEGRSQIDGTKKKGKHNYKPSLAVDILPYPSTINGVNVWNDKQRFCVLAGLIYAAASELGYKIRWGGDWDGDGNNADSTFHDLPHFEIIH